MKNLVGKSAKGIIWTMIGQFSGQIIQVLVSIILIRLLEPSDFGLIGMIAIFVGFANLLVNFGFGAAIIQKADLSNRAKSSVFWFNLVFGISLTILIILLSNSISIFYEEVRLRELIILISIVFTLTSFKIVQDALFRKNLKFKALEIRNIIASLVSGVVGCYCAWAGFGVYSLVYMQISKEALSSILIWILSDWRPKFVYKWEDVKSIMRFSSSIFFNSSLNHFVNNFDNVLIGKIIGATALGYYSKAFSIISFPVANISRVLSRVMFPMLSKIQMNKEKISSIYLKMTRTVAFFLSL